MRHLTIPEAKDAICGELTVPGDWVVANIATQMYWLISGFLVRLDAFERYSDLIVANVREGRCEGQKPLSETWPEVVARGTLPSFVRAGLGQAGRFQPSASQLAFRQSTEP
jgi:hypothetical protein